MTMKRKIDLNGKTVLVTGCPGFIGANLVMRLLREGFQGEPCRVVGLHNLDDYYDVSLKEYRLSVILTIKKRKIYLGKILNILYSI